MAIAESEIVRLRAVCMRCRGDATRTFRKSGSQAQVAIGDAAKYEALCYQCYVGACAARDSSHVATPMAVTA